MSGLAPDSLSSDGAALTEDAAAPLPVGERLRAAREEKGMSSADVAKMLKLSARQVEALENGDWASLPGPTFVRGFIRNYARLFKIDADVLVGALDADRLPLAPQLDLPETTSARLPESNAPHRRDFAAVLSGMAMIALAVLAYFFVPQDFWQSTLAEFSSAKQAIEPSPAGKTETPSPAVVELSPSVSVASPAPLAPKAPPESAPPVPPLSPAPAANAGNAVPVPQKSALPAAEGAAGVRLRFSKPSWVEIRDRNGQIVFSQLNPADSQRYVEGELPLSLVIGNASHVSVEFRGRQVEMLQRSKDDVARLTLE